MDKSWKVGSALATVTILAACGGSDLGSGSPEKNDAAADVTVPSLGPGKSFSFDLGTVVNGKYFVTDRTNKSVDVVDVDSLAFSQIKGTGSFAFAGAFADNGISGPDGINGIPGTTLLFVGDVNNVRVADAVSGTVQSTISTGNNGKRADEGCVDPDHNLYMIATPDADIPYASIISIPAQTVIATIRWIDTDGNAAGGNEQCQYDHASQSFLVNNDATIANPHGEVDVIPAASIASIPAGTTVDVFSLANVKRFPLGNCDPTGLVLGPGTEMASECRQGDAGAALTTLIMDRNTGAIITTVPVGGGDQVAFDARTNRYYVAASRWHASGKNDQGGGCSASNVCTPMLFVIDAASHAVVANFDTGNNAHSVAVDPVRGQVFVPYSSATNPAGCGTCTAKGFINGGISVFAL